MAGAPTTKRDAASGSAAGWLDERTRLGPLLSASLHVRIPMSARTYYFGGIALFLFGIQVVTGTLLSLYFKPTPEAAYGSVQFITSDVSFGWLIRSLHHWTANLMILFVFLHLGRVFLQAAYKYPRELTWVVGMLLFAVTLGFGFTGYLLPWDQRAYWATVVGTEIAGGVPGIGEPLLLLLRAGTEVTGDTMSRFFGIHVLVLPLALGALLGVHLLLVHQLGLANPKRAQSRATEAPDDERLRPFFPNYILDELVAWYVLLAVLVVLASLFPAGLEEQANALQTPAHIKPEWYYLGVYELLKLVPRVIGILTPVVGIGLLVVWPFLDRSPEVLPRRRKLVVGVATLVVIGLVGLTVIGYAS
ncbi:MAG TPA: cytochrome bc complex cytochrome b subunit [Candidatus Limnocylindrales bacterium]|jgi:quinol-cytochrome oxidoreductase complex cytochrome b subunit